MVAAGPILQKLRYFVWSRFHLEGFSPYGAWLRRAKNTSGSRRGQSAAGQPGAVRSVNIAQQKCVHAGIDATNSGVVHDLGALLQPDLSALEYWATGLEPMYLAGAFERAQSKV